MGGRQHEGANGEGIAPEQSSFKARLHTLEQLTEGRIIFLNLLPSFLCVCLNRHKQNSVLGRIFLGAFENSVRAGEARNRNKSWPTISMDGAESEYTGLMI